LANFLKSLKFKARKKPGRLFFRIISQRHAIQAYKYNPSREKEGGVRVGGESIGKFFLSRNRREHRPRHTKYTHRIKPVRESATEEILRNFLFCFFSRWRFFSFCLFFLFSFFCSL